MSFPRYPAYKDTDIEWIGAVPEHWSVERGRFLFEKLELPTDPEDGVVTAFRDGQVTLRENRRTEGFTVAVLEHGYQRVRRGDLVIHGMDAFAGAIGVSESTGKCTPEYSVLAPHRSETDSRYFAAVLRLMAQRNFVFVICPSVRERAPRFRYPAFKDVLLPVPQGAEQAAIAAFLDRETGKIDELVAEQRRLIELLKEKRQAVISHAVTKGLNPNAPMKPSGIEWLGDVPEHWEVVRVKAVSTFTTSGPRGWSDRVGDEGDLFIQSGDLNDCLQVSFETAKRVQAGDDAEASRTRLCDGDVVVCITGAKTGNVAVCACVPEAAYVNQHLCLIRPHQSVLPSYVGTSLKSKLGQTYFELSQYGLKQGLSLENVREAPILLPPIKEQACIVAFISAEAAKFDALTAEAQRAIELLQERRTALISAAVTGQAIAVAGGEVM